jgi:acyl-CoA synthetase (AMP-forming)/AMP-acid ligase II/acyl carrier protein
LLPGPALAQYLQEAGITIITLTPSALAALPAVRLPALRVINVAGEACSADLMRRWVEGRQFFNLYGPTEGTIWTTAVACQGSNEPPSIGRPIAHHQVYLLDRHQQPVPIGVPGELTIGGIGVASGYLNRPGLTAEKFIPNPFAKAADASSPVLYRTGDLARCRPDGNLEFLGRIDHQVKIRGFRIEIGEVETVLSTHPDIDKLVVVAHTDELTGDKSLVAYLVPHQEKPLPPDELRAFLQAKLPEYMIPATFVTLDALPITPNGKVDRRALPALTAFRPALTQTFIRPRTTVEEIVAQTWCEVIGLEQVGVFDNFFDLGGHSLKATQITSRLRQLLQIDLPLRAIFEQPTVQALAEVVEDRLLREIEVSDET